MPSRVPIMERTELEKLHTGSLLSRLDGLRKCEESFSASDRMDGEEPDPQITGFIEFKETSAWKQAYSDLKDVLSHREHLPSATERKEKRITQARRR